MDNEKLNTGENKLERFVSDCEKTVIRHVLVRTKGNITAAARLLVMFSYPALGLPAGPVIDR